MESLPPDVVRSAIFPYLDSLDVLACRYTCKSLCDDARGQRTFLSDATNKTTKYWRWLYSVIECWCYQCDPMIDYLYWLVRLARYQTIGGFFSSRKYKMIIKHCPKVLGRCMLGACARGDERIAKLVRGATPSSVYRKNMVLSEAARFNHVNLFTWLIDVGDVPRSDEHESYNVCTLIGENGSLPMLRTLLTRDFELDVDHWWLVAIHAMRLRHEHVMRAVYTHAPATIYSHRFLLASITNDNHVAFRVYLERSNIWPTAEDGRLLAIYNAVRIASIWDMVGLPMSDHTRAWWNNVTNR